MSVRRAARHLLIMRRREIEYSRNSRANCAASSSVLQLDVGVGFGSAIDVVARRLQFGVVAMAGTSQALEEDELEFIGFQDSEIPVGRLEKVGQVASQEREIQVCRDANRFGQPMANELLDHAVGHDNRHPLERIAPLMLGNGRSERRDQIFEPV